MSWSANTTLNLQAMRDININTAITATGDNAGLVLGYGTGHDYNLKMGTKVTLSGSNPLLKIGEVGVEDTYTVINSLGVAGDTSNTTLQGIKNSPQNKKYALGSNIDASITSTWNSGAGFEPIGVGSYCCFFVGTFDGLGHTVSNLYINRPSVDYVGLFGNALSNSSIRNVGVVGGSVTGKWFVGGLVGNSGYSHIRNSYATVNVSGVEYVGGLVGDASSNMPSNNSITDSYATGNVTATGGGVGGLAGAANATITRSFATGNVSGKQYVGGLVGYGGDISDSYATGNVSAIDVGTGGLVGANANISNSYSTGSVSQGGGVFIGGLIGGVTQYNSVNNSYFNTQTSGRGSVGFDFGTGKTTAEMKQKATFTNWDFTNTWRIVEGSSYPLLRALTQGTITIGTTPLNITASNVSKVYNGVAVNTVADLQKLGFTVTAGNTLANGDTLPALGVTGTGIWSGTLNVVGTGNTWQGAKNTGNYTIHPNGLSSQKYDIVYKDGSLAITPAVLSLVKVAGERVYDGTTNAYANDVWSLNGIVANDQGTVNLASGGIGVLDGKNVGTRQLISTGSLQLTGNAAQNYALTTKGSQWVITPKNLDLYAVSDTKVYDSTDNSGQHLNVVGLVGDDSVNNRVQAFDSKNVLGTNQSTVYVKKYVINDGNNGGNYLITTHDATGTIRPLSLVVKGASVEDKEFDGSPFASIQNAYVNSLGNDDLKLNLQLASFEDIYSGSDKKVTAYWDLGGSDAQNYFISNNPSKYYGRIYPNNVAGTVVCYLANACGMESHFGQQSQNIFDAIHVGADNLVIVVSHVPMDIINSAIKAGHNIRASYTDYSAARGLHKDEAGAMYALDLIADTGTLFGNVAVSTTTSVSEIISGSVVAKSTWMSAIEAIGTETNESQEVIQEWKDTANLAIDVIDFVKSAHELYGDVSKLSSANLSELAKSDPKIQNLVDNGKIYFTKEGNLKLSSSLGKIMKSNSIKAGLDSWDLTKDFVKLFDKDHG